MATTPPPLRFLPGSPPAPPSSEEEQVCQTLSPPESGLPIPLASPPLSLQMATTPALPPFRCPPPLVPPVNGRSWLGGGRPEFDRSSGTFACIQCKAFSVKHSV